ncbi:MAG: integrase arm-type DNA-binding domain-containing protein [Deltaproteobacteria bacterium]|jgi:integrase|nr:integrase arm-type DNA-binding domain-containing protein [Deltaproteobacteria bacterium]
MHSPNTNKLTDVQIRRLKAGEKPYKAMDGKGLYLYVPTTGAKIWRYNFRFQGRHKTLTIGPYPEVSLARAREKTMQARQALISGVDPAAQKKAEKEAAKTGSSDNSFGALTLEYLEVHREGLKEGYLKNTFGRVKLHLFPYLAHRPVNEIEPPELLAVLRRIEGQGLLETARRMRTLTSQVFRYAIATGRATRDIAWDLRGALKAPKTKHHPSLTNPKDLRRLLIAIDGYHGTPTVKAALRLAPLVFARPGELRRAEWSELDLAKREWKIPAEKMKMGRPHIVPLSAQAMSIIEDLRTRTGRGRYLFPGPRTAARPITDATLLNGLRSMGFTKDEIVPHGFRSIASTILNEQGYSPDWIERQLAHVPGGVRAAYNYAQYLPERRKMMQEWADYLDGLKKD